MARLIFISIFFCLLPLGISSALIVQQESDDDNDGDDDILLKCNVNGSMDNLRINWIRNGKIIRRSSSSMQQHFHMDDQQLRIKNVTPMDNGVYKCQVNSIISDNEFVLKLIDENYPEITILPQNRIVEIGTRASFRCSYKNSDRVEWIHDNRVMDPRKQRNERTNSIEVDENGSTLLFRNIQKEDEGVYLCRGKRGDKLQEFSSELSVSSEFVKLFSYFLGKNLN